MKNNNILIIFLIFLLSSCSLGVEKKTTEAIQSCYKISEMVSFQSFVTDNIKEVLLKDLGQKTDSKIVLKHPFLWKIPGDYLGKAMGIYTKDENGSLLYQTFFRVVDDEMLTTYEIRKKVIDGLPIYQLSGGMSPEFAVQKTLSNLTKGISHTWHIGPGGGPEPVWSSYDFIEKSIKKTIDLYENELGRDTPIETVVIGTGVPTVPYLTATTQAVFLPIQYLVSVNSMKEVSSIMDYAAKQKIMTYATLGYDASMDGVGVAWIKLLNLPEAYQEFIKRHGVKQVLIAGVGEDAYGESHVRRLLSSAKTQEEYTPQSLYILYTQGGSENDINKISSYIKDYDVNLLDNIRMIADWESGVCNRQITQLGKDINGKTSAKAYSISAPKDMQNLYNFAVTLSAHFIAKNKGVIPNLDARGFVLNEYLISHPIYELLHRQVPILYWQFVPAVNTIDRITALALPQVSQLLNGFEQDEISFHLNGRLFVDDLENELKARGYSKITKRTKGIEEVWDNLDGMNAPCEIIAEDIISNLGVDQYREWIDRLTFLSLEEIKAIVQGEKGISMKQL